MKTAHRYDPIFFDCDSTLSAVEGIDELAFRAGVAEELIPLTNAAMEGTIALEEVYGRRLDMIRPDRQAIDWLRQRYLDEMVAGAEEVVGTLLDRGHEVHIVSGGLRQAVLAVGRFLGIPEANIHAVDIRFDEAGQYAGFDQASPLARAGGKAVVCKQLLDEFSGPIRPVLIGDGMTDLEAADAGVQVIGFGGVARREAMVQEASFFVEGPSLTGVLDYLSRKINHYHSSGDR